MPTDSLFEDLLRYIGQTVTIFTTSGGISGSGFTGTLAGIGNGTVKLITDIGAAPACPIGSNCGCGSSGYGGFGNNGYNNGGFSFGNPYFGGNGYGFPPSNFLGSVTEIPINRIASFTHNAI